MGRRSSGWNTSPTSSTRDGDALPHVIVKLPATYAVRSSIKSPAAMYDVRHSSIDTRSTRT